MFPAELREVCFCCRWVGFEVETVSGTLRGCGRNGNRRRTLEEVPAELIRRVAESEHAPGNPAPSDFQRVDDGAEDPKRVSWVEAVGDLENVEDGADVLHEQLRGSALNVHRS